MWHPPPEIAPRNCTLINSSFGTLYRPPILDPPIRAPKNSPNSGRSKWPPKRDPTQKHPQNVHPPIRDPQKPQNTHTIQNKIQNILCGIQNTHHNTYTLWSIHGGHSVGVSNSGPPFHHGYKKCRIQNPPKQNIKSCLSILLEGAQEIIKTSSQWSSSSTHQNKQHTMCPSCIFYSQWLIGHVF